MSFCFSLRFRRSKRATASLIAAPFLCAQQQHPPAPCGAPDEGYCTGRLLLCANPHCSFVETLIAAVAPLFAGSLRSRRWSFVTVEPRACCLPCSAPPNVCRLLLFSRGMRPPLDRPLPASSPRSKPRCSPPPLHPPQFL